MNGELQAIKAAVAFETLVLELHEITRGGKVTCPFHDDRTPSCHIYSNGFYCFACGAHGDHVDWLKQVHNLSYDEAVRELKRRAVGFAPRLAARHRFSRPRTLGFKPVSDDVLDRHRRLAAELYRVPSSMEGRGFSVDDLRRLGVAALGDDAVFPIRSPEGVTIALKRRHATPRRTGRYSYETPGHGTPAWCSPGFLDHNTVLVVEGEFNGMACWLAAPDLSVMGVAGTGGALHSRALEGRTVYVYADGDEAGKKALTKWAHQALEAGAAKVYVLAPWTHDACEVSGRKGLTGLAELINASLHAASTVTAEKAETVVNVTSQGYGCRRGSRRRRLSEWFK